MKKRRGDPGFQEGLSVDDVEEDLESVKEVIPLPAAVKPVPEEPKGEKVTDKVLR